MAEGAKIPLILPAPVTVVPPVSSTVPTPTLHDLVLAELVVDVDVETALEVVAYIVGGVVITRETRLVALLEEVLDLCVLGVN